MDNHIDSSDNESTSEDDISENDNIPDIVPVKMLRLHPDKNPIIPLTKIRFYMLPN